MENKENNVPAAPVAGKDIVKLTNNIVAEAKQKNEEMLKRGLQVILLVIEEFPVDLDLLSIEVGEELDSYLASIHTRAAKSRDKCKETRLPITRVFDKIKSEFIDIEKRFDEEIGYIQNKRVLWAKEKDRRKRVEEAKQQLTINTRAFVAQAKEALSIEYREEFEAHLSDAISRLLKTFSEKEVSELHKFGEQLRRYKIPDPKNEILGKCTGKYVKGADPEIVDEVKNLFGKSINDIIFETLEAMHTKELAYYVKTLGDKIQDVIDSIPARMEELRLAAESEEKAKELAKADEERKAKIEEETKHQLNARSEAATLAEKGDLEGEMISAILSQDLGSPGSIPKSKGVNSSKKYKILGYQGIKAIMKYWIENHMYNHSVEDLAKKFKFMITAANRAYNKEGVDLTEATNELQVEEDHSVAINSSRK